MEQVNMFYKEMIDAVRDGKLTDIEICTLLQCIIKKIKEKEVWYSEFMFRQVLIHDMVLADKKDEQERKAKGDCSRLFETFNHLLQYQNDKAELAKMKENLEYHIKHIDDVWNK